MFRLCKTNPASNALKPASKIWHKRSEGLVMTTKGSKDLAGGKRLHQLVAIAYGEGVILAEPYEKMNADFFSDFNQRIFPTLFEIAGAEEREEKLFLMDNDPSQTSAKAKAAWSELQSLTKLLGTHSNLWRDEIKHGEKHI